MNTTIPLRFNFRKNWYQATVSMLQQGSDLYLLVDIWDKTIHSILSSKEVMFNFTHGLQCPHVQGLDPKGQELVFSLKNAVMEYFVRPTPVETAIGGYRGL